MPSIDFRLSMANYAGLSVAGPMNLDERTPVNSRHFNNNDSYNGRSVKDLSGDPSGIVQEELCNNNLAETAALLPHLHQGGILRYGSLEALTHIQKKILSNPIFREQYSDPDIQPCHSDITRTTDGRFLVTENVHIEFPNATGAPPIPTIQGECQYQLELVDLNGKIELQISVLKAELKSDDPVLLESLDENIETTEALHRRNCWAFLDALMKKIDNTTLGALPKDIQLLLILPQTDKTFIEHYPYEEKYATLIKTLNTHHINTQLQEESQQAQQAQLFHDGYDSRALNTLVQAIYTNDNQLLSRTYNAVKSVIDEQTPSQRSSLETRIKRFFKDDKQGIIHKILTFFKQKSGEKLGSSPAQENFSLNKIGSLTSETYDPMSQTSLPSKRETPWLTKSPTQIRLGTQVQRIGPTVKANPLFEAYLTSQATQQTDLDHAQPLTHIYFNFLKRDVDKGRPSGHKVERNAEANMTQVLENLERTHPNIAVITLPADHGLMEKSLYSQSSPTKIAADFFKELQTAVNTNQTGYDFYISSAIRDRANLNEKTITPLLKESFKAIGIDPSSQTAISPQQYQAIWVHFTKYVLPKALIDTLEPQTLNFTCKDGIDRGGFASVYYNLMRSLEPNNRPMTMDEFNREIHAAPTMVKGRGMNTHLNVLWNSVDLYLKANAHTIQANPKQQWLIEWRDLNCPKTKIDTLLTQRLEECQKAYPNQKPLFDEITRLKNTKGTNPAYLLEAVIHANNLLSGHALNPSQMSRLSAFEEKHNESAWFLGKVSGFFNRIKALFQPNTSALSPTETTTKLHNQSLKERFTTLKEHALQDNAPTERTAPSPIKH